jgi:transcriptional regulator with XRE-family HTH domain
MGRERTAAEAWGAVAGVRGLTCARLGGLLGIDRRQAYEWLSGERYPSAVTLRRLSVRLGRPVEAVLRACEAAVLRRQARLAVEAARVAAESDGE